VPPSGSPGAEALDEEKKQKDADDDEDD